MDATLFVLWTRLWKCVSFTRRFQCILLLSVIVVSAFADIVSIGVLLPFITLLLNPSSIETNNLISVISSWLGNPPYSELLGILTFFVIALTLVSGVLRIFLVWLNARISALIGGDLSIMVFQRTLARNYIYHTSTNSSEVLAGVNKAANLIGGLIQPTAQIVSSVILLFAAALIVVVVSPLTAMITVTGIGLLYFLIVLALKPYLTRASVVIGNDSSRMLRVLQEGLGAIKDVKINDLESFFVNQFTKTQVRYQRASANVQVLSASPKYVLEMAVVVSVTFTALVFSKDFSENPMIIPIVGTLVIGVQRLLPAVQQIYFAWSAIQGGRSSALDALEFLSFNIDEDTKKETQPRLPFNHRIRVESICFKYQEMDEYVLKDVSFKIDKGDHIGIVGKSGSGKSTLMDLMMGLSQPSSGKIFVDGELLGKKNVKSWYKRISHVPQQIYLYDGTLEENIAFGQPNALIDRARIRQLIERLGLESINANRQTDENTTIGERGRLVSGGQAQRVGIARALYKNADVLFFDEATSALDSESEREFLNVVKALPSGTTVFFIAHKPSLLSSCDHLFEIKHGELVAIRKNK